MSYDVSLQIKGPYDAEPVSLFWRNYTSNCGPMWRAAGADLSEMNGWKAARVAEVLTEALEVMHANEGDYRAMEPSNGWGSYDGVIDFLTDIRDAAARLPQADCVVSW
jgi:hypothetical protein